MSATIPAALIGATEAARDAAYDRAARAALATLRPDNPTACVLVLAAGETINGTPTALVRWNGATRRALYTPALPRPLQVGGLVWAQQVAPDDPLLVIVATRYQVPYVPSRYGGTTGSTLGVGSAPGAGVAPSTDWAAGMTDPTNEDGALFPLTLGEVAH